MIRFMGVDPGVANCGFVIIEDGIPIHWGGWYKYKGPFDSRSANIVHHLQQIAAAWNVTAVITERFFAPAGKMAVTLRQANYQRGGFDALFRLGFSHLHFMDIHPSHLKSWATGKGNAPKERTAKTGSRQTVIEGLEQRFEGKHLDELKENIAAGNQNHVIEAWALAEMGRQLWRQQWKFLPHVRTRETVALRMASKGAPPWSAPMLEKMFYIPLIPIVTDPE